MAYPTMPGYPVYQQPYPQPYQDRLAQLQNQYQQTIPQMQPQQQTINQGLLWVQGEAGAKSYLVAPNTTVLLMDSDNTVFYIKSADNAGMPSLRTFSYVETTNNANSPQPDEQAKDFIERDEFENFKSEIMEKFKAPPSRAKKTNIGEQE